MDRSFELTSPSDEVVNHFTTDDLVELHVGQPTVIFRVYRSLLVNASRYFGACLEKGIFEESQTNTIVLVDEDPLLFQDVVSWLFRGKDATYVSEIRSTAQLDAAIDLYILADKLLLSALQNEVMDRIFAYEKSIYAPGKRKSAIVPECLCRVPSELPLYQFYVSLLAHRCLENPLPIWRRHLHGVGGKDTFRSSTNLLDAEQQTMANDVLTKMVVMGAMSQGSPDMPRDRLCPTNRKASFFHVGENIAEKPRPATEQDLLSGDEVHGESDLFFTAKLAAARVPQSEAVPGKI